MKHRKVITGQQKAAIIDAYLSTEESSRSIANRYGINHCTLLIWVKKYKEEVMGQKTKKSKEEPSAAHEISKDLELQRLKKELAQKDLIIKVLEKTIEKANEAFGVDIKKKVRHEVIWELKVGLGVSIGRLCDIFTITRQAYYQSLKDAQIREFEQELLVQKVLDLRKVHKKKGGKKLYLAMKGLLQELDIKMGRDMFFKFLRDNNLLIRARKIRAITTDSKHWYKKYSNLIKEFVPFGPNRLWVSDITYIRFGDKFAYLSLITDAYSRKIVGYSVREDLKSQGPLDALKMAIAGSGKEKLSELIHHSDRGVQYCCDEYVNLLTKKEISISMTEKGDPLENALAERVNGIVKNEYELMDLKAIQCVKNKVAEAVFDYNNIRPHNSIDNLTPNEAHTRTGFIPRLWKTKDYTKKIA